MELTVAKTDLQKELQLCQGVVEKRSTIPILSNVLLKAADGRLQIAATDLDVTIARLRAYEGAGADVLYAPGLRSVDEIRAVCDAVSRPVNVLAVPVLSLAEIFGAGAQRVSVGGSLTWVAVKAMADAAAAIRDHGDLSALAARVPLDEWL